MQRRVAVERIGIPSRQPTRAIPACCSASAQARAVSPTDEWTPVSSTGLLWALWDLDNVVFHIETGETHLLSELPTLLLEMVQAGRARTTDELSRQSADACGSLADVRWRAKIDAVLRSLENLELIKRLPPTSA